MQWGGAQRSDLRPTTDGAKRHNPEATLVLFQWPCDSELAQFQIPITQSRKGRCGINLATVFRVWGGVHVVRHCVCQSE